MTPFRYVEFYDVPRCIALEYRGELYLLQSAFDEAMDEYPDTYSVYVLPDGAHARLRENRWDFLEDTPLHCLGDIRIDEVSFDETKRKELDASILDDLIDKWEPGKRE